MDIIYEALQDQIDIQMEELVDILEAYYECERAVAVDYSRESAPAAIFTRIFTHLEALARIEDEVADYVGYEAWELDE